MPWRASSHAKYDCKYHLIWCPKRRRPLGAADVRAYEELAIERDHVHLFLEFPPKYTIAWLVGILKSISASRTFQQFPSLRRKYWSGELWEDGYPCARSAIA
jgi:putative transposase